MKTTCERLGHAQGSTGGFPVENLLSPDMASPAKFTVRFFDLQVGDGWLSSPRKSPPAVLHTRTLPE